MSIFGADDPELWRLIIATMEMPTRLNWLRAQGEEIVRRLTPTTDRDAADLGCGRGALIEGLSASASFRALIGVDVTAELVEDARRSGIRAQFVVSNALEFLRQREAGSFSLITCYGTSIVGYSDPLNDRQLFRELRRVLHHDQGVFVYEAAVPDWVPRETDFGFVRRTIEVGSDSMATFRYVFPNRSRAIITKCLLYRPERLSDLATNEGLKVRLVESLEGIPLTEMSSRFVAIMTPET